jgi:hypothetical protein
VEGRWCLAPSHNHPNYSIGVLDHVASSHAQHREAGPFQICLAQRVDAHLVAEFMHRAVDLDQQARRQACEVRDITADRVLTSEFESFRSSAKSPP